MRYDLTGNWTITANQVQKQGQLPGTLDTNGIGNIDKVAKPWHPDVEDRNKHMEKMRRLIQGSTLGSQGSTPMRARLHFRRLLMKSLPPTKDSLS